MNTRPTHFSTCNKRFDKSDTFRPVRDSTDKISAEALVTNTNVLNQGKKIREATRPCIYCKGNHCNATVAASNIPMCLLERNNYKRKDDALFALELVMFPKSVQLVLSFVIIVKGLYIIIEVFIKFEILDESDIKKTSVNLCSAGADQPPQSDEKNSESVTVVSRGRKNIVTDCSSYGVWQRWNTVSGMHLMDSTSHQTFMTEQMVKCLNLLSK